ncbi:MAG: bifunctional DNA-formamidopyrimidine glycosylase/DNA-(apurinic or apyrimidinic site) lyase [Herpetosiphonaceae bacterium]|nr:bifunctional DNA-formamidopyrimidine glycosylase/DNA-(apurinic or apyrimidinic site) lyase [Herpetosiphonaceae bacterium]
MPELPEVETVRRSLATQLIGLRITGCPHLDWPRTIAAPAAAQFCALLQDRPITAVERRAKYLILRLDQGEALVIHLRMTGQLTVQPAGTLPDSHTHVIFDLDDGRRLRFRDARKFGRVWLLDAPGLALLHRHLGPEPLDEALTAAEFALLLRRRKGALKPILLNQQVIAGLGNIYVDEALWQARLHPLRTVPSLTDDDVQQLFQAIQSVLRSAIEHRGTTFGQYVDGLGQAGANQHHLNVYGRQGEPCSRCGTPIEKLTVAQRGTHVCPHCQLRP